MIKLVFCLRRLPELTQADFQYYWRERHAPLVRRHAGVLRIRRYVQTHAFRDERIAAAADARGSLDAPYDGVAELWWDSLEDIVAAGATPEGRAAGRELVADEKRFIDLAHSTIFFSREHVVIG